MKRSPHSPGDNSTILTNLTKPYCSRETLVANSSSVGDWNQRRHNRSFKADRYFDIILNWLIDITRIGSHCCVGTGCTQVTTCTLQKALQIVDCATM